MEQDKENFNKNEQVESEPTNTSAQMDQGSMNDSEATSPVTAPSSRVSFYAALIVIALLLAGALWWMFGMDNFGSTNQAQNTDSYPEVVATVNGTDIMRDAFIRNLSQTEQVATAQGADLSDATVKQQVEEQAISSLINTEVLVQAANAAGVEVTDEAVNQQISDLETQYGDAAGLAAEMEKFDLTEAELRANIREQLLVENYLVNSAEYTSVTVSDEEVEEFYNALAAQGQELPPLADVADQVKQSLLGQKQQQVVGALLERLKNEASIEIMI